MCKTNPFHLFVWHKHEAQGWPGDYRGSYQTITGAIAAAEEAPGRDLYGFRAVVLIATQGGLVPAAEYGRASDLDKADWRRVGGW